MKKYQLVCVVPMMIAIIALAAGAVEKKIIENGNYVEKNENGEGDRELKLYVESPDVMEAEEYDLSIPERNLAKEEVYDLLSKARDELQRTICAENTSLKQICKSLNLPAKFCDGRVKASYEITPDGCIDEEGNILWDNIEKNTEIEINTVLECQKTEVEDIYTGLIYKDGLDKKEILRLGINRFFNSQYEAHPIDPKVELPTEIAGNKIIWSEQSSVPYKLIFIFAIGIAGMLIYLKYKEGTKESLLRSEQLKEQYPEMIDQITLLIAAGMNIHGAWKKVVGRYLLDLEAGAATIAVYDEMNITLQEIKDGVSEAAAYERFASRTGLQCYRRFSGLLIQNLKKGGGGMLGQLEREVTDAFEDKKREAKRIGEQAGTKLLMPMILMLGVVLVVLMAPVLMGM